MSEIRVLLADDHNVLRQGIAQALDRQPDIRVVAQTDNGRDAVDLARAHQPDVILLDINMPALDGVAATQQIVAESPRSRVIILTMYRRDDYVLAAIRAGASGYLLKEVELEALLAAVRSVAGGEAVLDPAVAGRVLAELRRPTAPPETANSDLDERDRAILRLVAQGMSNQAIADRLHLAEKTIRNRLSALFKRLNVENRTQAALYARRLGLGEEPEDEP